MNEYLSLDDVQALARDVLIRAGTSAGNAAIVARSIRLAEGDGLRDAGLGALPDVVEHLRSGRVNGSAAPRVHRSGPAALTVDAGGGFACPAIEEGHAQLLQDARSCGIAILTISDAYPLTLPAHPAESCALAGLVGICMATTRVSRAVTGDIAAPRQMALALPQANGPPVILQDRAVAGSAFAALVQVLAGGAAVPISDSGGPEFEGPLGGPFRSGHCLIAILPETLKSVANPVQPDPVAHALQDIRRRTDAKGVEVPADLLQRIINA